MRRKILIVAGFCLAVSACQQPAAETKTPNVNQTANQKQVAKPSPTATPTPAPTPTPDPSKIKTYKGKGTVTKINLEIVSVELDHEEIKGLMAAMRMEFYVKEKSELEVLQVGDKVDFVLEDNAGAERIISIKKQN